MFSTPQTVFLSSKPLFQTTHDYVTERAVVLYSCRYLRLFWFLFRISSVHPQASPHPECTSTWIGSLSKHTHHVIALHYDALAEIGFSNASDKCKISQTLALPVDDRCETSVFCRSIAFCRTAWAGQPQYVLWWWIATVKYKHLTHHPFYSQIHQLTQTTWDHQICAFNCQAGHQTSDVIRCRRFHLICSWYISHPDPN